MKAIYFLVGAAALALAVTSCSIDETSQANDTNAISFKATVPYASRATATTTNNLTGFSVWGWTENGMVMDGVTAKPDGNGTYSTTPTYFWSTDPMDFIALSPIMDNNDVAEATIDPNGQQTVGTVCVTIPSNYADQIDLCYAYTPDRTAGTVTMNFRHALSQVMFAARNTNAKLKIYIQDVNLCSVGDKGTYSLPSKGTMENLPTDDLGTGGISDSQGVWTMEEVSNETKFTVGLNLTDGCVTVPTDGTSVSLISDNGSLFLIPQEVAGWDTNADQTLNGVGAYFRINCKIYQNDDLLWPILKDGETEEAAGFAEIAIPVDVTWKEGYKYTYTFVFGEGAGYYPPDDETNAGEEVPFLPIRFDISVDEFQASSSDSNILDYLIDEEFKAYIEENYDLDGDEILTEEEAALVTTIECHTATDFTGIDKFPNLVSFTSYSAEKVDFSKNAELEEVAFSNNNRYNETKGYGAPIKELDLSNNLKMTEISNYACSYCRELTSVKLPETLTSMGQYAFQCCISLQSIELPDGLSSIKGGIFYGCTSLTGVTLPTKELTRLPANMFELCSSLTSVVIPDCVTETGGYVFQDCENLTSVTLSKNLETLGAYVFRRCYSLTSITLPDCLETIGNYDFSYCTALESITIPDTVTSLGTYAFEYCEKLTNIKLSSALTTISQYAFRYSGLTSIEIPENVTKIDSYAFRECTDLAQVKLNDKLEAINTYAFYGCESLESIEIPDTVTSTGTYTFAYCTALTNAKLSSSVTSLPSYAFYHCESLASITIPESVTTINNYAFRYCSLLASVTSLNTTPPDISANSFTNIADNAVLYVPDGYTEAYADWAQYFGGGIEAIVD